MFYFIFQFRYSELIADGDSKTVLQKLAEMSVIQSGTELSDIDAITGALRTSPKAHVKLGLNIIASRGTNTKDLQNLPTGMLH